jgi:NAD(P)-dependent dehydrogenase (short-subunit alcohol dehydrogenase family)
MPLLDLSDSQSINCFASNFLSKYEKLDFLINNAGIMALPNLERDKRGIEMQFAVNYLGHFHLTLKLLPALKRAGAARVINTSSRAHRLCGVNFGDINFHKTIYNKWNSYAQSKSANVLFTVELDRQMKDSGIRSFAVHPGLVPFTNLARRQDDSKTSQKSAAFLKKAFYFLSQNFPSAILKVKNLGKRGGDRLKTIEQGAAAILWCLTSPLLEGKGGLYCEDCNIAEIVIADGKSGNKISPSGVYPWAIDCGLAKKLWEIGLKAIEADKLVE